MVELDDEGMSNSLTYILLIRNYRGLFIFENELLTHDLHSIESAVYQAPDQINFAETTDSQALEDAVAFQRSLSTIP